MKFCFGDIVVVESSLIGVVVKSWEDRTYDVVIDAESFYSVEGLILNDQDKYEEIDGSLIQPSEVNHIMIRDVVDDRFVVTAVDGVSVDSLPEDVSITEYDGKQVGSLADSACSVHHVVDKDNVFILHFTDDCHAFHYICFSALLVAEYQWSAEEFSVAISTFCTTNVWRSNHQILEFE